MGLLVVAAAPTELGDLSGEALGVGVVRATAATARRLARGEVDGVVLVGTAGALPGGPEIGAVVAARRVSLGSTAAALGLGYVPLAPPPLAGDAGLRARLALPEVDVVTHVAITTDPALADRVAAEASVEHMEAYGVAWACAEAGVPFVAVLGITNRVGPDAHAEWMAHRAEAESAARDAVRRRLLGG